MKVLETRLLRYIGDKGIKNTRKKEEKRMKVLETRFLRYIGDKEIKTHEKDADYVQRTKDDKIS